MALFGALSLASQALLSQQIAVNTTNRNLSNVNTDGYSREEPVFADIPGGGVTVATLRRVFSSVLFKRFISENQNNAYLKAKSEVLSQVESLFNDQMGSGLSQAINDFFSVMNDVAVNPADLAARQELLSKAQVLVGRIRDSYSALQEIKSTYSKQVAESVSNLNQLLEKLADINRNIPLFADSPDRLNQYLDERDRTIKEISSIIDAKVQFNSDGTVNLYTAKGFALVLGDRTFKVTVKNTDSGVKVLADGRDITSDLSGGSVGGLVSALNVVESAMERLNTLTSTIANEVNAQHEQGYNLYGETGIDLFASDNGQPIDASNIVLAFNDPKKFAAASDPNYLDSDNGNVKALMALADKTYTQLNGLSFAEYYGTQITSWIGQEVESNDNLLKNSDFQLDAIKQKVEELSGVNTDEELVNLTRYQRAYQAAARVVTVTDELLQTILNMAG
ncbi:flagellar hook-associated protein FlgK [Thermovibrio ammonificans HB-1]|uniref:Flagellar hook-associated protein 1 n=1 Tax=Thermovibrio ammonificans (strain DSM 15698 / JCM 12110 / HB-1) TaxID=648996 RepID=E8T3U1_THEA1|nr:flagellar hook-associated protein FlgK [Thermovibrio ammonificans]ADU97348.1 flagellar hook-associated protein FlgK [Thermovibrio ammonificans HB-1]